MSVLLLVLSGTHYEKTSTTFLALSRLEDVTHPFTGGKCNEGGVVAGANCILMLTSGWCNCLNCLHISVLTPVWLSDFKVQGDLGVVIRSLGNTVGRDVEPSFAKVVCELFPIIGICWVGYLLITSYKDHSRWP